ncbi:M48 family metallopeptidase [Undibacterium cyanobacteriorum]|uniref:M48 family metallopeptidase n=1 Tax=Undibacterium cyanobacteriorum TaxID=3073561 RepID=A0ABY9RL61_9BURK|nr:M48 family metallopeptidase [Undibacterium sp. 20NA77.5]WMW81102.1 M48 family metallopeptidase [Undibacterium sp. 20NA77.5]
MNFFEHQHQAHRESKKLLLLFFLAVIAIVVAINYLALGVWIWTKGGGHIASYHLYPTTYYWIVSGLTIALIAGGSLYQMAELSSGGEAVAEMAGGRLVDPNSKDRQERRLLNIVEEMALASGIACPKVYVMDEEDAINAFAAGYHQNEAVVAVTRGTLSRLNRDELQGVIGHEFSHILNGDMRMNVKLIGVLFGIQMIAGFGEILIDWGSRFRVSRSRDDKGVSFQLVLLVVGVALFVIGYIGVVCGRLIKSAVSRQREFLADASAVQFTRNPDGIGGALKKIGGLTKVNQCGSRIRNPHAEQLSHMFLGAAKPSLLSGLFATHPPITTRLERLYGRPVEFLGADVIEDDGVDEGFSDQAMGFASVQGISDQRIAPTKQGFDPRHGYVNPVTETRDASLELAPKAAPSHAKIPDELRAAARDTTAAQALAYACLLDRRDPSAFQVQVEILKSTVPQLCQLALMFEEQLQVHMRVPLLDLATPALRMLDVDQKKHLLRIVGKLINADQVVSETEFVLQTILERRLNEFSGRAVSVKYQSLDELQGEVALLLSMMAHTDGDATSARLAFQKVQIADLKLQARDYIEPTQIDYIQVKQALGRLNQLAPLVKPFLIRALMQVVGQTPRPAAHDLLRAIGAAIDVPLPELVQQAA